MLAGFYGIEKDNRVAALGLLIHDRACQQAEKEAMQNLHSEVDKVEQEGEVKKTIDSFKVIIIACGVIIAIIIISIVFIILLRTRRQKRRAKVADRITVLNEDDLGNVDTEAGLKTKPVVSSLPNRDMNKDNVQLDTQDDINLVGMGTGRTT